MTITPDKLAKYYKPLTPADLDAAQNATRESTAAFADKVNVKADDLMGRWLDFAVAKWGPQGFSYVPESKDRTEFDADKAKFGEFRDWLLVGIPPSVKPWKETYAEIKGTSAAQYFPGYWKGAWVRVFANNQDVSYHGGEFDEWSKAHPPKTPEPTPPKPPPPPPPPPPPVVEPPVNQAGVGLPESSSGWMWFAAAGVTLGWLALRKRK